MSHAELRIRFQSSGELGRGARSADDLLLEVAEERVTLRELIRRIVAENARQAGAPIRVTRVARYLGIEEIEARARDGKVSVEADRRGAVVNAEREVERALDAFERGRYLVLVDGRQVERLEEELDFRDQTHVTFLRITPLVGG